MKQYQSPALYSPDDPEIIESTQGDPESAKRKCDELNAKIITNAIGTATGWPSKWTKEIETEPHGAEWLAARKDAYEITKANGILILHGKRGGGKTRMAAELALAAGHSRYRTAMRFFLEIRATFKDSTKSELAIIDELRGAELLIIDELQERGDTAFEDRLLTHLIDARYADNRPTILIANLTRRELRESLGTAIVDRVRENGKSIEFTWASYRTPKQV